MASNQESAAVERPMSNSIKVAFWNLGWQETMLRGRNRELHFRKLQDVAKLWHYHDLHILMLCELGEHDKGFSTDDQTDIADRILDNIRRWPRFINRGHEQYGKAAEPVLRSSWQGSYFAVWDAQRLTVDGVPNVVYFGDDDYRHYVMLVVRKPTHCMRGQYQSVLLVNAHAPDGKHRLTNAKRRKLLSSVRAEATRLADGRFICGGDLNTDPYMIRQLHPDLHLVASKLYPLQRGDCACVGGLMAAQTDSNIGRSYQLDRSASDAHDAVVVKATIFDTSNIGFLAPNTTSYDGRHLPDAVSANTPPWKALTGCSSSDPAVGDIRVVDAREASTIPDTNTVTDTGRYRSYDGVVEPTVPTGDIESITGDTSEITLDETTGLHGDDDKSTRHVPDLRPVLTLYDGAGTAQYIIHPTGSPSIVHRADDPTRIQFIHGAIEPISEAAQIMVRAFYDSTLAVNGRSTQVMTFATDDLSVEPTHQTKATVDGKASLPTVAKSDQRFEVDEGTSVSCETDTTVHDDAKLGNSQTGVTVPKQSEHTFGEQVGNPALDHPVCTICKWRRSLITNTDDEVPLWACDSCDPRILNILHTLPSGVWRDIISTNRLCSPNVPIARDGRMWVRIPLRCPEDVQCNGQWYRYEGMWKSAGETVTGFHNTQMETWWILVVRCLPLHPSGCIHCSVNLFVFATR